MEKLVYAALAVLIAAIAAVFGGAYLLHTGLAEGNLWKVSAGVLVAILGLIGFGSTAKVFDPMD